jgi:hypothetical protein
MMHFDLANSGIMLGSVPAKALLDATKAKHKARAPK